jgi:hypothetical protein
MIQAAEPDQHSYPFAASDASFPFKAFSGRLICRRHFQTPGVLHFNGTPGSNRL